MTGLSWLLLRRRLPQAPSVGRLSYAARSTTTTTTSSMKKANRPSSIRAGNFTDVEEVHEIRAQEFHRPRTIILGRTEVPLEVDWGAYMGQPMEQEVEGTCTPVSCTVCVRAVHGIESEKLGTAIVGLEFPSRLAMRNLFIDCAADGIWVWGEGARVDRVLKKIQEMGGLVAPLDKHVLPLSSWEEHWWGHYAGDGLWAERVAQLLSRAPCVGLLWVFGPSYQRIDADQDEERVYTTGGFARRSDEAKRNEIEKRYPGQAGWHAVVCYRYRFRGGRMDVLVLDNHTPRGPRRWVHVEEFNWMYALTCLGAPTSGRQG